jgi:long-subunit acyl-CoA synthetase (AMP-forming)
MGYLKNKKKTIKTIREDRFIRTGDKATIKNG